MTRDASVEARRYRLHLQEARRKLRDALVVIAEYRDREIDAWLSPRLVDPSAFDVFVGRENVITPAGRIDWPELELRLRALLQQRPYLATSA